MINKAQSILVTGGAGYIGSHTCKALSKNGFIPITYDNLSNGHKWAVKWGPLEIGDVRDSKQLKTVIAKYHPPAVLHFAASIEVAESVRNPEAFYDNNVGGMVSLLQVMVESDIQYLIFSSSCAVYGISEVLPITESCSIAPINPYGEDKAIAERMIREQHEKHNMSAVSLRYFNAAGADPDCEIGEAHDPESHLIPILLEKGALQGDTVDIYDDNYDTPDGTCLRDFIHVSDLADAHVLALQKLLKTGGYEEYNLGNGKAYSVKEVLKSAEIQTGNLIKYQILGRREGDPPALVADSSKIIAQLDWQPKYNDIDIIIKTAWDWLKKIKT